MAAKLALGAEDEAQGERDDDAKCEVDLAADRRDFQPRPGRPPGLS